MTYSLGLIAVAAGIFLVAEGAAQASDSEDDSMTDDFTRWDALIKQYALARNVPWRWIKAIMMNESNLGRHPAVARGLANPNDSSSVSDDGLSYGLCQLTVDTANRSRVRPGTTWQELNVPEINVDCSCRYVSELMRFYFPGDREGVIRGYNGGPGWRSASQKSLSMTEQYYNRFQSNLARVLAIQPGDEMDRS